MNMKTDIVDESGFCSVHESYHCECYRPSLSKPDFIKELQSLLKKHGATIRVTDQWTGYAECGKELHIEVEFDDHKKPNIDLGERVDAKQHCGRGCA
jgi:hypothetical protein